MRRLRIAPSTQLQLLSDADEPAGAAGIWALLPAMTQARVLALLARLIARGLVDEESAR